MQSDTLYLIVPPILIIVSAVIFAFAARFSFLIVRALATPLYKSRARWTGLLSISFIIFLIMVIIEVLLPKTPFVPNLTLEAYVTFYVAFPVVLLVLYAWIDRTISLAVSQDYLGRDPLRWKKIRPLYWAVVAVQSILLFLVPVGFLFFYPEMTILNGIGMLLFSVTLAYSAVALAIAGIRTKDLTLRNHLKWFGYNLLALLLTVIIAIFSTVFSWFPVIFVSYCFYRMARSLAPISRLSPSDLTIPPARLPEN